MTVPWWQSRMAALDVESTGVDVESDRVVTVAVVLVGAGIAPERLALLSDVGGVEIPEGATAVHGITSAKAHGEGLPARDVLTAVHCALAPAARAGYPLVVMNAPFDLSLIDREMRRHGLDPLPFMRVVDPYVCDRHLDKYRRGSRKLDALCAHHGVVLDDAHEAAADALAAARLAWCIGARGEVKRRVRNAQDGRELARLKREWEAVRGDLDALHTAQVGWAAEQATGLRDYFIGKGQLEDAASVSTEWPLRSLPVAEAA